MTVWLALVIAAFAAWVYLLCFHGRFWFADQRLEEFADAREHWPEVVAVIPARDEADVITETLHSHLACSYPGRFSIVLVDDHSSDGTGDIGLNLADDGSRSLTITNPPPLEDGWSGKLWAVHHGLAIAKERAPDATYVLLTDADIVHAPATLTKLVAKAEDDGRALVSLMARLDSRGVWGGLLIPAFVFFFQKLYPFPPVNDPRSPHAAAAGGCVLVRRDALDASGGVAPIRNALIDDCSLARLIKGRPAERPIWLGLADEEVLSRRDNRSLGSVWMMVARTAYAQLHHSTLLLLGTLIGMAFVYWVGPLALLTWGLHGDPWVAGLGAAIWAMMVLAYAPTARLYGQSPLAGFLLPLTATLYSGMTFDSARRSWTGRGGLWKGRTYPQT